MPTQPAPWNETNLKRLTTPTGNFLAPLFWQRGGDEATLRDEIQKMKQGGIGAFVIEPRPHPDYLGPGWWRDMDIVLDEAKKHAMQVWFFDDSRFPSGFAAGKVRDEAPELLKVFLAEKHIDAAGPLSGSSFRVNAWLEPGERLVAVVAARRVDGENKLDGETLTELSALLSDGILYWDVPPGHWRIFILIRTRSGGEAETADYINPLDPRAMQAYLNIVHEAHYQHYKAEFGKTIQGFFLDEPRFGSQASYWVTVGRGIGVIPYSDLLLDELARAYGADFRRVLPGLWYEAGALTARARFTYMDVVSRLVAANYFQQEGDWCRAHGVKLIGHIIEENGAHARLGYGAGHFFRNMQGQDFAGLDLVYNVWPEYTSGKFNTPFFECDAEFNYWGIAKMASSAAHLDPKKQGMTLAEVFGAYGWQEGLKLMKWLTDHVTVRGVNYLVPHAFSTLFPDPDCPPHFYARGANPQWQYFKIWADYANRLCSMLSGGQHSAPAAVLYHAEAEWAGSYEPFETVVKSLALSQIDCDVVPIDALLDKSITRVEEGRLVIQAESYAGLVIPYAECLPFELLKTLEGMASAGLPVFFIKSLPARSLKDERELKGTLNRLVASSNVTITSLRDLAGHFRWMGLEDIQVRAGKEIPTLEPLRVLHYLKPGFELYFFTNESKTQSVSEAVAFRQSGRPLLYDALEDRVLPCDYTQQAGKVEVALRLEPYQSVFVLFGEANEPDQPSAPSPAPENAVPAWPVQGDWTVSATPTGEPDFTRLDGVHGLGNLARPGLLPAFSGTLQYEIEFEYRPEGALNALLDLGELYETAEVWLNGERLGAKICPPYRFETGGCLKVGLNRLKVAVTNTLAKQMGDNPFDRAMPQEPSGLIGPVQLR